MNSDQKIISDILSGSKDRYGELVSRYQQNVFSVALKIIHNSKDAEDITQEVFVQAYKSLASFQFDSNFSTWLYRITVNKGLDWKRKNHKSLIIDFKENDIYEESQKIFLLPEEQVLENYQKESIKLGIEKLPKKYQAVITLYYFENLTYQQIADKLGIAKKTVESQLYRARLMLKEILVKEGF